MSAYQTEGNGDESIVPFSVSVLNLLQEISDKLDRPMISVVNNGMSGQVNPEPEKVIVDPNFEMLAAICFELNAELSGVLDSDLNAFERAQQLRRIAANTHAKGLKFKSQADEIKAKLEREK